MPRVVRPLLLAEQRTDAARADSAWHGLSRNVRVVGELVRRVGRAEADRDAAEVTRLRGELERAAASVLQRDGDEPLLKLRALQTELFVDAVRSAERSGRTSEELRELGGTLAERANGVEAERRRKARIADETLVALYRMRWAGLLGFGTDGPLAPTLNDHRLFYAYRLHRTNGRLGRQSRLEAQLEDVRALARLDPSYPGDYAAGIVLYQLGAVDEALQSFRAHLRAHPDGAWSLRARNYATACAARLFSE